MSESHPVDPKLAAEKKATVQKLVTALSSKEKPVEISDVDRVQRMIDTNQAKQDLERLADAGARQARQLQQGKAAKEMVNATIDASLNKARGEQQVATAPPTVAPTQK